MRKNFACTLLRVAYHAVATPVLVLCLFFGMQEVARSTTVCGNAACETETKHPLSWLQMNDGTGNLRDKSSLDEGALAAAATEACAFFAAAHGMTVSACALNTPVVPDTNAGATSTPIYVQGTYVPIGGGASSSWNSSLLMVNCADGLNPNSPAVGTNGQCYCKPPMHWDPAKNGGSCVLVRDIFRAVCAVCKELRVGNPILPLTGAKVQREELGFALGKDMLAAAYDTRLNLPYVVSPTPIDGGGRTVAIPPSSLGASWVTSFHKSLYVQRSSTANTGFTVQAFRGDGRFISFNHPTATSYVPAHPGVSERMEPVLDGSGNQTSQVRLIDVQGNIELYEMYSITTGSKGYLLSTSYASGGGLTYTYGSGAQLLKVTDHQGKSIRFSYEPVGSSSQIRIKSVQGSDARVISFTYTASNQLSQITWPDGKTRKYLYERSDLPWAMTGSIDENDSRLATYTYDADGRAIATEHVGGVGRYAVSWEFSPSQSVTETWAANVLTRDHWLVLNGNVTLELPNGGSSLLGAVDIGGAPFLSGQTQAAGSGGPASSNAMSYDASGNVLSQDDFQGQRTCYTYDASNRETVRVEGLGNAVTCSTVTPVGASLPTGARKITTAWHPDWRKPTQVTQPFRKTTSVYHGQPDPFEGNATANCTAAAARVDGRPLPVICKQVEQATTLSAATDSSASDDPYPEVALLLHGNGANNSTSITDDSIAHRAITVVGDTKISTAQSKFGGASIAFDGNGDFLTMATSGLAFGTGDFTIEGWFYLTSASSNYKYLFGMDYGSSSLTVRFGNDGFGGRLQFGIDGNTLAGVYSSQYTQSALAGSWHHVAFTRSAGTVRAFLDGSLLTLRNNNYTGAAVTSWADGRSISSLTAAYVSASSTLGWLGYIDDLRVTKGAARYTANFTQPTQEFSAPATSAITKFNYDPSGRVISSVDPNSRTTTYAYFTDTVLSGTYDPKIEFVSLLLHGNGANNSTSISDDSIAHGALSVVGDTKISTAQSKFGGASVAFDGNGDYLSASPDGLNFGTGDFAVEGWFYLTTATTDYKYLYAQHWGSAWLSIRFGNSGFGGRLQFGINDTTLAGVYSSQHTQTSLVGGWHHVAFTRSGGTVRAFLDGSLLTVRNNNYTGSAVTSWADTSTIAPTTEAYVSAGGTSAWLGYIDDLRVTNGVARYTADFTAPAQEFLHTTPTIASTGHTVGDLASITNAAGHVTQFNLYDPAGRVRQTTDPKGGVTDITYTSRGLVSTVTTTPPGLSARVTTYTYDHVGQVTGVTQADGTTLAYSYDAAHRLIGATDSRGNAVTYTLDSAGNRISEEVRDPTGTLQRSISRSFDALNRLQQVTGAAQ